MIKVKSHYVDTEFKRHLCWCKMQYQRNPAGGSAVHHSGKAGVKGGKGEKGKVTWCGSLHSQGKQAGYSCLMEVPAALGVALAFFCHLLEALTDSNNFSGSWTHTPCVVRKFSLRFS